MKRLIDANALQQEFDRYIQRNREHSDTPNRYCADVAEVLRDFLVETATTVDAVEVVRCKDCKSMLREVTLSSGRCLCDRLSLWVFDNDFCSSGERRSE